MHWQVRYSLPSSAEEFLARFYPPVTRASFLAGFCISAAGIAFIGWAPWNLADALFFLNGIGLGSIIASGNIIITQLVSAAGGSEASALAWVHLAWGLGAVSCPWLFRTATEASTPVLFFALLGVAFGLLAVGLFFWDRNSPIHLQARREEDYTSLSSRTRCFYAIALLLYTGAENAISGWLPSYVTRLQGGLPQAALPQSRPLGALAFTLLWAGTLSGRAAIPFALRFIRERTIYKRAILSLLMSLVLLMGRSRRTQRNQPGPLWNFGSLWLESRGNLPTPDGKIAQAIRKHTRHRQGVGLRQRRGRQLTLAHRLCIHIVW
jgi:MFS transporter, FHS family, glucose/mannose:H+ symporter